MRRAAAVFALAFAVAPSAVAAAPVEISATVDRTSVGLGDPFRYTVEARGRGALRVIADSGPFVVLSGPTATQSRDGDVNVVRVDQTLVCLDRGCAPGVNARRVRLPAARAASGGVSSVAAPAAIAVVPRVPAKAVAARRPAFRGDTDAPAPSTPISFVALALLAAGAALLVAIALLLVVRRPAGSRASARTAVTLEQVLRLLRESAGRPVPDRRRAADYAGVAAAARGDSAVAGDASRVAWAPPDPEASDVDELADRIEASLGSGR